MLSGKGSPVPETDRASQGRGLTVSLRSRTALLLTFAFAENLSRGLPNVAAEAEAEPAQGGAA